MSDLAIGWIVIPGVVVSALASVAGAVLTYYSTRDLKRVESRLRRDEETYRLAQSPRVTAAIELWSAFCRFEIAVEKALYPNMFDLYEAPTTEELDDLVKDNAHVERAKEQLRAALKELLPVLNKAELLLDPTTFAACSRLFEAYDSAYGEKTLAKDLLAGGHWTLQQAREIQRQAETRRCRAEALAALQAMIGMETRK